MVGQGPEFDNPILRKKGGEGPRSTRRSFRATVAIRAEREERGRYGFTRCDLSEAHERDDVIPGPCEYEDRFTRTVYRCMALDGDGLLLFSIRL